MSTADWEARLREVKDRIGKVEWSVKAETTALLALMTAGADTTEAKQRLCRAQGVLADLRRQQRTLETMKQAKP
ncbi:hypothetical protein [Methylobacterium nigriterrae]|uniref:hypothetical protein n=1 Tax=Methylobacterium nigriterrae TaxID=3127512 RepID=UPI003013C4AB